MRLSKFAAGAGRTNINLWRQKKKNTSSVQMTSITLWSCDTSSFPHSDRWELDRCRSETIKNCLTFYSATRSSEKTKRKFSTGIMISITSSHMSMFLQRKIALHLIILNFTTWIASPRNHLRQLRLSSHSIFHSNDAAGQLFAKNPLKKKFQINFSYF